jgi:hypothetical protein
MQVEKIPFREAVMRLRGCTDETHGRTA